MSHGGSGRRRDRDHFVNNLQEKYNADKVVQVRKEKVKEDERRLERIAKCERMGVGLGQRLGSGPTGDTGPETCPKTLLGHSGRQGGHVDQLQAQYNRQANARELKMQQEAEIKRQLKLEQLRLSELKRGQDPVLGHAHAVTAPKVTNEELRSRRVAQMQEQYKRANGDDNSKMQ